MLQDIIGSGEIKLDFFFKASLTNDIVNVSVTIAYQLRFHMFMPQAKILECACRNRITCLL